MPLRDYEDEVITPEKLRRERRRSLSKFILQSLVVVALVAGMVVAVNLLAD